MPEEEGDDEQDASGESEPEEEDQDMGVRESEGPQIEVEEEDVSEEDEEEEQDEDEDAKEPEEDEVRLTYEVHHAKIHEGPGSKQEYILNQYKRGDQIGKGQHGQVYVCYDMAKEGHPKRVRKIATFPSHRLSSRPRP